MGISIHRLRHVAGGLLANFISRNNNVERLWALGVLYTEARSAANSVELDLLAGRAVPDTPAASSVARTYAAFLQHAMERHGFTPGALASATVSITFGLPQDRAQPDKDAFGDPFDCSLTLVSREGISVCYGATRRCAPHDSRLFAREMAVRDAGFKLLRAVSQRSRDCDGRWPLEMLRDADEGEYEVELDLLHERATPDRAANTTVARLYAATLRGLLGEWMTELAAAELRIRFSASAAPASSLVYVETRLVTDGGRVTWFNLVQRMVPAPPWEA